MANSKNKLQDLLTNIGKMLIAPIAVLPIVAILFKLGDASVLDIPWLKEVGVAVFKNIELIFAASIAVGASEENNGVAAISAAVGYFILTNVSKTINADIHTSIKIFASIVSGISGGLLYNKYKDIKLPQILGFFGGKRFVPIVTSFVGLLLGLITGFIWP
ncbi:PTS transporter subunit EIIC [Clostridium amazonitimonense]|uniref:PTS transporter subunit EIIC n=1 Tax=Clostridium amazonitimonense TaxID=1499689 RepID=UPI000509CB1F|nr:PTS transporter subunit EIIC [Clostridium amazonitimonense]